MHIYFEKSDRLIGVKTLICYPSRKARRGRGRITRIVSLLYCRLRFVTHFDAAE